MNREKLKRIIEDIEATEAAIKDLSAHKREVYAGVAAEFEPKILRKIVQRRKMDPDSRTRDDDLLDQYESALGMTGKLAKAAASGDKTYEEAAEEAGVSRRTMARQVARQKGVPKATDSGTDPKPDSSKERPVGNVAKPQGDAEQAVAVSHHPERPSLSAGWAPGPQDTLDFPDFLRREQVPA